MMSRRQKKHAPSQPAPPTEPESVVITELSEIAIARVVSPGQVFGDPGSKQASAAASVLPPPSDVERQTLVTGLLPNLASFFKGKSEVGS